MKTTLFSLLYLATLSCSNSEELPKSSDVNILNQAGATKVMNTFDEESCSYYWMEAGNNSSGATITKSLVRNDKIEGMGAFKLSYNFPSKSATYTSNYVLIEELWADFRSDLSFYPLGVSLWVKGKTTNKNDVLRILLMQDETLIAPREKRTYFQFDAKDVLINAKWQQIVIPYSEFKFFKGTAGAKLNFSRIVGWRFDIVNKENSIHSGELLIDKFEQLTSYKPSYKTPLFSSLFIQLNEVYSNEKWRDDFSACKDVKIDTWIIGDSHGFGEQHKISWYAGSDAPWNEVEYPMIDSMVVAAEQTDFKLIFGLCAGEYGNDLNNPAVYDKLLAQNKLVIDELYARFGNSPCFAGWYIAEEFYDGVYPDDRWHNPTARNLLANYLQGVSAYAKSKPNKYPVTIAPALWRGKPADLCGEFFRSLLEKTPDVDFLYLQDCAGRCLADVDVDLPNYFAEVKKACDATGVEFGVDVESFLWCSCPSVKYHSKTWSELKEQLQMAGLFTKNITNFSWATFKPGLNSFDGYKTYLKTNNLMK